MAHGPSWERGLRFSSDFVPYRRFPRAPPLLGHSGCSVRQVSGERGHEETQELLAGVLVEQQLVLRLLHRGLCWVLLEELMEKQLVLAKLGVLPLVLPEAKKVDLQFRSSKGPLEWWSCQLFVIYRRGPSRIRVAAVL